jgi:hypothetical protein
MTPDAVTMPSLDLRVGSAKAASRGFVTLRIETRDRLAGS